MNRLPHLSGFTAGALFAGLALLLSIVLRTIFGGAFFSSILAPLAILVVLELIWAVWVLSKRSE